MGNFTFVRTALVGAVVIEPAVFSDNRGYFMETYRESEFREAGIDTRFVQDNQSRSRRGVLRGLHFQRTAQQGKLVRAVYGEVFDVAVDLRENSATYGKWEGIFLSAENRRQFYIPRGFAHGFLVLSDMAEVVYKCDDYYHAGDEGGLRWDDPALGINWPVPEGAQVSLSEKDLSYIPFPEQKIILRG